jgi:hypothetical protein
MSVYIDNHSAAILTLDILSDASCDAYNRNATCKHIYPTLLQELDQLRRLLGPPLEALTRLAPGDGLLTGDVDSVHLLARRVKDLAIQL